MKSQHVSAMEKIQMITGNFDVSFTHDDHGCCLVRRASAFTKVSFGTVSDGIHPCFEIVCVRVRVCQDFFYRNIEHEVTTLTFSQV